MERVTGIGGVFFKTNDPDKLKEWYRDHLGVPVDDDGYVSFRWRDREDPERVGFTAWQTFPEDTSYFDPSKAPFMINYRVRDLHRMLDQLRKAGVEVSERTEESEYGKFGWASDPDGNRIELWEPPENS